ncbi:hypothetical protein [Micromonospora sp. NPDC051006]|uniref:hypothetical protein n=1 Tax=Micromonospora sp. NPDC051006 TaxID=3364283 RepID=UPI0037A03DE3
MALAGLIALGGAHYRPWVSVRPGRDVVHLLLGRDAPSTEVRTYALTDLPGSLVALYVGWLGLLALLVLAWLRPQWRDLLRLVLGATTLALVALTFLPSGAAVRDSGFPVADRPSTDYLQGTWLGLAGTLLLAGAVSALLAAPLRVATSTAAGATPAATVAEPGADPGHEPEATDPTTSAPSDASAPGRVEHGQPAESVPEPIVLTLPVPGAYPRRAVPRWRRPLRIGVVTVALVAAAALIGVVGWKLAHPPAQASDAAGGLAARLVAPPQDATPGRGPAADDQVDFTRIVSLDRGPGALLLVTQLTEVRHAASAAWTEPNSAARTVVLLQFDTPTLAEEFATSYADLERSLRAPAGEVTLKSVPGATAFVGPSGDDVSLPEVHAVAQRDDIVLLVTAGGAGSHDVTAAESLLRQQYDRL